MCKTIRKKLTFDVMNLNAAVQQCSDDGGALPVPRSDVENECIFALYENQQSHSFAWLGVNDEATEDTWVDNDGSELTFLPWADWEWGVEPTGGRAENAAVLVRAGGLARWADVPTYRQEGVICVIYA